MRTVLFGDNPDAFYLNSKQTIYFCSILLMRNIEYDDDWTRNIEISDLEKDGKMPSSERVIHFLEMKWLHAQKPALSCSKYETLKYCYASLYEFSSAESNLFC